MEEGFIHLYLMVVAHEQAAKVSQPGKRAFDLPPLAVTTQRASIVERRLAAIFAVRTDQQHAPLEQAPAQGIAVVTPVGNDAQRSLLRSASPAPPHGDLRQRAFGQSYFARTGRDQLASQRNTLAVDHHHPLRAFAALG